MSNAAFYGKLASTVDRLLLRFGASAQLQRIGSTNYDPNDSQTTSSTPAVESLTACVFDYDEKVIDGSLIQRGDKQAFVSAIGVAEPATTDRFIWVGEVYTIIKHKELSPAGAVNVLYEWQVRK